MLSLNKAKKPIKRLFNRISFSNRSSVANTILFPIGLCIFLVVVLISIASYFYIQNKLENFTKKELELYVQDRSHHESLWFSLVDQRLTDLRAEYITRYKNLNQDSALLRFDDYFQMNEDGSAYVRSKYFKGDNDSHLNGFSGGIDKSYPLSKDRMARLVLAQEMLFQHGPSFVQTTTPAPQRITPFMNFYLETPEKDLLVYWPGTPWYPDYKGGYDIATQGDFSKIFDPSIPFGQRERSWTGAYQDDVPKIWMVSYTMPVEVDGKSIAAVGVDISLSDLITRLKKGSLEGSTNLILRKDGALIAHPDLMQEIILKNGRFNLKKDGDASLRALYKQIAADPEKTIVDDQVHNRLIAFNKISGPEWLFVTIYPKQIISYKAFEAVIFMISIGLTSLILALWALRKIVKRNVAKPLGDFLVAVETISAGDLNQSTSNLPTHRKDEYGVLANSFLEMTLSLKKAEALYTSMVSSMAEGAVFQGADGHIISINPMAEHILERTAQDIIGKTSRDSDWGAIKEDGSPFPGEEHPAMAALNSGKSQFNTVMGILRPSGERRWISINSAPVFSEFNNELLGVIATFHDITQQKRNEHELRISAKAFDGSLDGMFVTDANQVILSVNKAFTNMTGYSADEVIGQTPRVLSSGRHDKQFYRSMWEALNKNHYWQGEICNRRKNGEIYFEWVSITAIIDHDRNQISNFVASFSDITSRKDAEELNYKLMFFDGLTNLPNRRLFLDRLKQILLSTARKKNRGAILFIDLDDFKVLNETRGYDVGDLLLGEIARRVQIQIHDDDILARLGGDEFAIVLQGLDAKTGEAALQAETVAKRILAAIKEPVDLAGKIYNCKASIGVCLFDDNSLNAEDLLKRADTAVSQAKNTGRNKIHFFDPHMQEILESRILLESMLEAAIPNQLALYYQVQVDTHGNPIGAEALIRWQHPDGRMVSPAEFIPLAERTGHILAIGHWVLEEVCKQLKAWETDAVKRHLPLSVNVSAKQFHQPGFVVEVLSILEKTGADPSKLELELTESMLVEDVDKIVAKMEVLRSKGIRFSLDDFGTGFSSLAYLKRLPLDQLKIDQSFVRDIMTDSNDASIVRTIISLGQSLNIAVIAEGVETDDQKNFLQTHGCLQYQGYLFSKPLPIDEFEKLVHTIDQNQPG